MDDQELDARASSGVLYWEGAVRMRAEDGATGRAYLELTGYAERVPFESHSPWSFEKRAR